MGRTDLTEADRSIGKQRRFLRHILLIGGPLVGLAVVAAWYVTTGRYVVTDDAYVQAHQVQVAARVQGHVTAVHVQEHDAVHPGQPLFTVDQSTYLTQIAQAEAAVYSSRDQIRSLKEQYHQQQAELARLQNDINYYQRNFGRIDALASRHMASEAARDDARRGLDTARQQALATRRAIGALVQQLSGNPDIDPDQHPQVRSALAQLDMARLQLGYTEVKATIDGVIGPMDLQVGDFVNPGQQVFSIVSAHPYIEANYKETQLTHVHPGMKVKVTVDTYPGLEWHGQVTSISPASGLELSLLPPQNATGNWVKVVQRIPVRFELDFPPRYPPLRAGMSVIATIDIGHHRGYWMRQGAEALLTQSDDHGAVSAAPMASTTTP